MAEHSELRGLTERLKKANTREEQDQLWSQLFPKLHAIARNRIRASGRQESPTELVNELFPRLQRALDSVETEFSSRAQFFAYAAQAMRRHLAAEARKRILEEAMDDAFAVETASPAVLLALNECLDRLANRYPRAVRAFELKEYGGHSYEEILDIMPEYPTRALLAADLTKVRKLLLAALGGREQT